MTTPIYTVCVWGRQTEGPVSLGGPDVPMQTQRWDVCHAEPVFARLSTESPPGCLLPGADLCWEQSTGRGANTQEMKERPQMSCVSPGARGAHLTQPCPASKSKKALFFSPYIWGGLILVLLEARLNVRAAMEAADLTNLLQTPHALGLARTQQHKQHSLDLVCWDSLLPHKYHQRICLSIVCFTVTVKSKNYVCHCTFWDPHWQIKLYVAYQS